MADKPKIGVFMSNRPLILTPFPNGGWSVTQAGLHRGQLCEEVGAYTNAEDLLDALRDALEQPKGVHPSLPASRI